MAHPGGRPTKYTPELQAKANEYLDTYEKLGDKIPSHEGLFLFIGISNACGYDWVKQDSKEEFSKTLARCTQMQKRKLINSGLDNTFNSNITKLVLHQHGLSDKTDTKSVATVNVNMRDVSEMTDEELEDELKD